MRANREMVSTPRERRNAAGEKGGWLRRHLWLIATFLLVPSEGFGLAAAKSAGIGEIVASASLTDFTQLYSWLFLIGIAVVVITLAVWGLVRGVRPTRVLGAFAVGVVIIVAAVFGAQLFGTALCTTNCAPAPAPATATTAVSIVSANFVTGETLQLSPLTVNVDLVFNTSSAAFCVTNVLQKCPAAAHNYVVIPVQLSRTDNINATYGFTTALNNIPTLTNSSTGLVFAPIGYTAATSTSPGIWKVQWNAGSISGTNPTQNAPSVTSGVGSDLVGVPAFGSKVVALSLSLAGGNSTTGTFGYMANGYATYPMQIAIGGGGGATPSFVTVNFVFLGTHA
ncbi:MAG: hypothetical protein KGI98_12070 [Euryarchaeota archaeon]|nr:hypothetical protein [Euryarchaeota archaeon]MDE1881206.1 hypothetical protein [Euryarchaeota archaeon]